jgi:glycopeptide antibiotics resistance protein
LLSAPLCLALEGTQFILQSRFPQLQDAFSLWLGAAIGVMASTLPPFRTHGAAVALGITFFHAGAIFLRGLHPYIWLTDPAPFHWIPFMTYYERTSFQVLGDFLQELVSYLSLGFVWAYLVSNPMASWTGALVSALVLSGTVEFAQRFLEGRFSDTTEICSALLGATLGHLAWTHGKTTWEWHFHPQPRKI